MHAIVTGAAGGIGLAVVADLVKHDVRIFAWDASRKALDRLRGEHGPLVQPRCVDVTSASAVADAATNVTSTHGAPDYLVCAVVTFLLGEGASFVTGTALPIDGGPGAS